MINIICQLSPHINSSNYLLFHSFIQFMQKQLLHYIFSQLESQKGEQFDVAKQSLFKLFQTVDKDLPLLNQYITFTSDFIMNSKEIDTNQKVLQYQSILTHIIDIIIKNKYSIGIQSLRIMFDLNKQYYKYNALDRNVDYPIGKERILQNYTPQINEECDVIKPYITATSPFGWVRCMLLNISQNGVYSIKYHNQTDIVTLKDKPLFAPLGSRCKDFDWRMNLKVGDMVDAQDAKAVWYYSTIVEQLIENGTKKVRVTFRQFNQNGDKIDSENKRYFGWGANQDEIFDVMSPKIQLPHKMHKKLCYYSSGNHSEFIIEDSFDIAYEQEYKIKPFYGMLRLGLCKSQTIITLFNHFIMNNGINIINEMILNNQNIDIILNASIVIGMTTFLLPRMAVNEIYKPFIQNLLEFVKKNVKLINVARYELIIFILDTTLKRIVSLSQKHEIIQSLKRQFLIQLLSLNLQKQLLAVRLINQTIRPMKPLTNEKKEEHLQFLRQNNIFQKLFQQSNIHQHILMRSIQFLKYLLANNQISFRHLEHLWKVIPMNDLRGRAVLEKLIGDLIPDMCHEHVQFILQKLFQIKEIDLTIDNLNLLKVVKNKLYNRDYIIKTLEYLWDLLTIKSVNLKTVIQHQVELVFKGFIFTLNDYEIRFQLLKDMLKRLKQVKFIKNEATLLKEFITGYKASRSPQDTIQVPVSIPQVTKYLRQEGIYTFLFNLISIQKTEEKIKEILTFLNYLFRNDNQTDISQFAKQIYLKLGPTQLVLNWLKQSADKLIAFSEWLFNDLDTIPLYINLTITGYQALKTLFFEVNSSHGNIKLSKEKVAIALDAIGPKTKQDADTIYIQWVQKQFFVTKFPEYLIGINFWEKLLEIVKDIPVHSQIIQLIVKLIVSLDQTLFQHTIKIRKFYLERFVRNLLKINQIKQFTQVHKSIVLRNLSIINELMAETQVDGLFNLQPHFQTTDGQAVNLKIQNNYLNSKAPREINLTVSQNITIWKLKTTIAKLIDESPLNIDIYRMKRIENKSNGKSLAQCDFFKNQSIKIQKTRVKNINRCNLLNNDSLTQKMNSLVENWFNKYKDEHNLLSQQNLNRFYKDYTRGVIKINVTNIIQKFDSDGDSKITLDEFKQHIKLRCKQQTQGIWKFLNLNGYRNDLKHKTQIETKLTVEALPRYILSNENTWEPIFKMLQNPILKPIHYDLFRLINSLPTINIIKQNLTKDLSIEYLKNITCNYQLCYNITVLYQQLNKLNETFFHFIKIDGISYLLNIIKGLELNEKNIYEFELQVKQLINNILKILNLYYFVFNLDNPIIYTIYYQKINILQIKQFINVLNKKSAATDFLIQVNKTCKQINLNYQEINQVVYTILNNLIINYKNIFLREIIMQTSKLSIFMTKMIYPTTEILYRGIFVDCLSLRRTCSNILYYLSQVKVQNPQQIIDDLLNLQIPTQSRQNSGEYFLLLSKMIQKILNQPESQLNLLDLTEEFIKKILTTPSQQKRNYFTSDKVLQGKLQFIYAILSKRQDICKKVSHYKTQFMTGLFSYNIQQKIQKITITSQNLSLDKPSKIIQNDVIFISEPNRRLIMDIIVLLVKNSQEDNQFFQNYLLPIIKFQPQRPRKPSTKVICVGLYNLGSICYMNSMLQMLATIQPFRNGLLMAKNSDSKLLIELQRLYSYLYYSERQDFVPDQILKAFNPPINPLLQQDTTQFLNFLFDHIDIQLKPTPFKNLLREIFQGNTVVQMICHSCGKKRQRKEQFYCYTVGVKDKNNLEEALQAMHAGEVISDCLCQQCGNRGDLTKRSLLGDIPNILFIHLQRIVFNLDIFMNTKIHTRLSFPTEINLQPFTKQGVQLRQSLGIQYMKKLSENDQQNTKFKKLTLHDKNQKFYNVKLKGIIVHSGSADVGHYYSIVSRDKGIWLKLDDSRTSIYSTSLIQSECYGGSYTAGQQWAMMGEQSKNAYVLVYQKQMKSPIKVNTEQIDSQTLDFFEIKDKSINEIEYNKFKIYNQQNLFKEVWLDNHMLMLELHTLSDQFKTDFIKFIQKILECSKANQKAQFILITFFKICYLSGQVGNLIQLLEKSQMNAFDLFTKYLSDYKRVGDTLFHNDKNIRVAAAKCFKIIIINCLKDQEEQSKQKVFQLLNFFFVLLNTQIARNWLKCQSFFTFINFLVQQSAKIPLLYVYFLEKRLISLYIDFILEKDSPLKLTHKKHQMGSKYTPVEFESAIKTIYFFVQRSYYLIGQSFEVQTFPPQQLYHFNQEQAIALSCMQFYSKMIKQKQNIQYLKFIIHRLCIKNKPFSENICRVLLTIFNQTMQKYDELKLVLSCIEQVLRINDQLWLYRAQMILGYGQPYTSKANTFSHVQQQRFIFSSVIQNIFPIECVLCYLYANRLRNPFCTFYMINSILRVIDQSQSTKRYFIKQPSFTYNYFRYYQWIKPYLLGVKGMLNQEKMDLKQFDSTLQQSLQILGDLDKYAVQNNLKHNNLITGTTILKQSLKRTQITPQKKIYQQMNQSEVYCLRSMPLPEDISINQAFQNYLTKGRLQIKNLNPQSNILYFMQASDPPIVLKNEAPAPKEQAQISNLVPLGFEVDQVPKNSNNTDKAVIYYDSENIKQPIQKDDLTNPYTEQIQQNKSKESNLKQQQESNGFNQSKEKKQQQKIIQQQKKQQQPQQIIKVDLKNIFTNNYFREIVIENKEESNIWVRIQFINSDVEETNALLPTVVSNLIKANSKQTLILFNKYNYQRQWGTISYKIIIQDGRKYSNQKQKVISNFKLYQINQSTSKTPEVKQQPQPTNQNNNDGDMQVSDEENANLEEQQKICKFCTLRNPATATQCEACESQL